MSTKSSIFLTNDNEHCYVETNSYTDDQMDIFMEFSKKNIEIILNDDEDLVIKIKGGTEIHKIIGNIKS